MGRSSMKLSALYSESRGKMALRDENHDSFLRRRRIKRKTRMSKRRKSKRRMSLAPGEI